MTERGPALVVDMRSTGQDRRRHPGVAVPYGRITADSERRRDISTISVIGLAHGTSHFFHMLLPPLFPAFINDFGLSYSQLGLLVTTFFIISGTGQALSGFLVDRIGGRKHIDAVGRGPGGGLGGGHGPGRVGP